MIFLEKKQVVYSLNIDSAIGLFLLFVVHVTCFFCFLGCFSLHQVHVEV